MYGIIHVGLLRTLLCYMSFCCGLWWELWEF